MQDNNRKTERVTELIAQVNKLPLEEVVGRVVDLVPRGPHYLGLCPFHADHQLGSFVVTPSKNLWKCFADGFGGNGIAFEMRYYDLTFLEAVFRLALDFGLIGQSEYVSLSRKRYDKTVIERARARIEETVKIPQNKAADIRIRDTVYRAMQAVCPLSARHREHLERERQVSDLEYYFTFPTKRVLPVTRAMFLQIGEELSRRYCGKRYEDLPEGEVSKLDKLAHQAVERGPHALHYVTVSLLPVQTLSLPSKIIRYLGDQMAEGKENLTVAEIKAIDERLSEVRKQLPYVPGFFINEKGELDFVSYSGIGLLAVNEKDQVVGVQVRRDRIRTGESRYIWMSSSFAEIKDGYSGGASSGSPGGFIPARNGLRPQLCVTEGRFKAEKIADKGNDAVYVSGVSTWKSILPMLQNVAHGRHAVYIMFDADAMGNVAVHRQLTMFAEALAKDGFRPRLLVWPKERGKGFDDLVINTGERYASYMKSESLEDFEAGYQKALRMVLDKYHADDIRGIGPDSSAAFCADLQSAVEEKILALA